MIDVLHRYPLAEVLGDLATPAGIHRLAMRPFPDLAGSSQAIRADLGLQFRLSLPSEIDGTSGHVVLRYRMDEKLASTLDMVPVEAPGTLSAGDTVTARLVAIRRYNSPEGKVHQRPVFDEVAEEWASELFGRHGMEVDVLDVSRRWTVGRSADPTPRNGANFVVRDVTVRLTSPPASQEPYLRGIGRGRAYGFGMLIVPSVAAQPITA